MAKNEKAAYATAVWFQIRTDKCDAFVDQTRPHLEGWIRELPGFVEATLHAALDKQRVLVYIVWDNKESAINYRIGPDSDQLWQVIQSSGALQRDSHTYKVIEVIRRRG
jgi:heme-degrading monooxygenase HmoA